MDGYAVRGGGVWGGLWVGADVEFVSLDLVVSTNSFSFERRTQGLFWWVLLREEEALFLQISMDSENYSFPNCHF